MRKGVLTLAALLSLSAIASGCSGGSGFDPSREIIVNTREESSGTRGAFVKLFGIEDMVSSAEQTSSTGVMITSVEQNRYAIGYISLGALKDSVKAVKIDGAEATVENVKNGTYKVSRPFNIVAKENLSDAARDFIGFILSADGQAIVAEENYICLENAPAYSGSKPSGKISIDGSTSVYPLMEKLKEAYLEVNPNAEIELQAIDSGTGIKDAANGVVDIGMSSRDLKDSELELGVTATVIATDGIAVIVNPENIADDLTSEQVWAIYTGEAETWNDVIN